VIPGLRSLRSLTRGYYLPPFRGWLKLINQLDLIVTVLSLILRWNPTSRWTGARKHVPELGSYPYAVTSQRFLYVPSAGYGHDINSLLAYFIEGRCLFFESASASLFGSSSDRNRRRRIAMVHLGFLF
jgi:hypothetical protein